MCLYQWVSDVGIWVYVCVCEKGRTKKGPGEVLRVLLWAITQGNLPVNFMVPPEYPEPRFSTCRGQSFRLSISPEI